MNSKYHLTTAMPQHEVWEFITTPDNRKQWVSGLLSSTLVKGNYHDKGDLLRVLFLINGTETEFREEIAAIIPGEMLQLHFISPGSSAALTIRLTPDDFLTTITLDLEVEWKGVRSILLKSFWQPAVEKRLHRSLDSLRKILKAEVVLVAANNSTNDTAA